MKEQILLKIDLPDLYLEIKRLSKGFFKSNKFQINYNGINGVEFYYIPYLTILDTEIDKKEKDLYLVLINNDFKNFEIKLMKKQKIEDFINGLKKTKDLIKYIKNFNETK